MGHVAEGIEKLEKSLQAYPGNLYAKHALAALRLRYAYELPEYNSETKALIADAIGALRELVPLQHMKTDQYPLVTLALRHTGVLIEHGQTAEAKSVAKEYLAEVQRAARSTPSAALESVKECMIRFLSQGDWEPPSFRTER